MKVEDLSGLRKPTEIELKLISLYMSNLKGHKRPIVAVISDVLLVLCGAVLILAILSLINIGLNISPSYIFLVAFLCLLGSIATTIISMKTTPKIKYYLNGDFKVCDGFISKIEDCVENNNIKVCKVIFSSMNDDILDEKFDVVNEEIELGSHLLIVVSDTYKVFTDYMLSQKGRKKPI